MDNAAQPVGVVLRAQTSAGRSLTPMQRPLWMSQLLQPDAPLQNVALLSHVAGTIDATRLAEAFDSVFMASDALQTRIIEIDGATQVVCDAEPPDHEVVNDLDPDAFADLARRSMSTPIDMSQCGVRSTIAHHPDGTSSWMLTMHHAVTDAVSSAQVFNSTVAAYAGEHVDLPGYYSWAAAHDAPASGDRAARRRQRARDHWSARPAAAKVARLYRPVRAPGAAASRVDVPLDDVRLARIEQSLSGEFRMLHDDLAWATMLTTATAAYIHHVSGVDRFAIGLPIHNRSGLESRSLIGPVMEVYPIDIAIEPGQSYRSLHASVAASVMEVLANAVPGTAPAADYIAVVNVLKNTHTGDLGGFDTATTWLEAGAIDPTHLLRVQLRTGPHGDTLLGLDVNHAAAEPTHRDRVPDHFRSVLDTLIDQPDTAIGHTIIGDAELAAITDWESGPARADNDDARTIVDLVRSNLTGVDATVVSDVDRTLSGAELLEDIERIAAWMRTQGVEPGTRVGIELPRSVDAIVAILASLWVGASFVPLDPAHPAARRRDLARRGNCVLVVSHLPHARSLPAAAPTDEASTPQPDDEAYLLFTSGSTGEPKGVPITHAGLVDYITFAVDSYVDPDGPPPVAPLFTSLGFDLTITSVFVPLVAPGGELIAVAADGPAALTEIARTTRITWCKATPSHLALLTRMLPADHQLATLIVGGEAFGSGLARRLLDAAPHLAIYNEYGPTEAVVGCMIHRVDPERVDDHAEVPIGVPAPGVTLRIVSPELERVPIGSVGELCIHRPFMTAGYLTSGDGQTDLDDAFVQLDDTRFYRSGDLVRLADDHTLVYLGRVDEQVKVGGIRLEPTEVEDTLESHPAISAAAVRLWSPTPTEPDHRCVRCGLASNVPGITFDDVGVCSTCHSFDRVAPQTASWFRTEADLEAKLRDARERRTGDHDFLHLLSGGKDSTYALYRMVGLGYRPYVMTLDNGFIAEEAKDNVRRSVAELGLDHEFATTDAMNAIFRDSLERHSNVCHGCYKTIYTLATTRAHELGIPMIVTGLSRGQLFETRLIPQQFTPGRFDPDAIDRAVVSARKRYHRLDDGPNRLLDTTVFDDDSVFDQIEYLDFYRYVDVELADMLSFLDTSAPWVRPKDSGRSTNCLVNAAGIHNHVLEQGFHNYAVPYAWDVRLGHKTRQEAIEELDDQLDIDDVSRMLDEIGHVPNPREILTAWIEVADGHDTPSPAELRRWVADSLPKHAVPAAFVTVEALPLTTNGKLDVDALPVPSRTHRSAGGITVAPETELEAAIVAVWEAVLQTEPIGVDDDFFALGGDSLAALEMGIAVEEATGLLVGDDDAFIHSTPRELATALTELSSADELPTTVTETETGTEQVEWSDTNPPPMSPGELTILAEQSRRPHEVMYNVGRRHIVHGAVDGPRFADAARTVAALHIPLSWSFGARRRRLQSHDAVTVDISSDARSLADLDVDIERYHRRPFDLEHGPLLRCWIQPLDDGTTLVLLVCHHVSADAQSFSVLWSQIEAAYSTGSAPRLDNDYPNVVARQQRRGAQVVDAEARDASTSLAIATPPADTPDGFVTRRATVSRRGLDSRAGSTAFASALSATAAVVRRHSTEDQIRLQVIASSRERSTADDLVGYFLETRPLDVGCAPRDTLGELTERLRSAVPRLRQHVSSQSATPNLSNGLDVLVAFDDLSDTTFAGHRVEQRVLHNGAAVADVTFFVELRDEHVDLSIEHSGSALTAVMARQMIDDLDAALTAIVESPGTRVGDIVTPGVETSIIHGADLAVPHSIVPRMLSVAQQQPAEPAVHVGSTLLSWQQLDERSRQLAAHMASRGVQHGDRVLLMLERSTDLVVAVLATLRLGAAYVPVDVSYPADRRQLIIDAADARAAFVDTSLGLGSLTDCDLDVATALDDDATAGYVDADIGADDVAYVIFTSGSTGTPRGVPVTHGQLAASTMARTDVYPEPPGNFLVVSSPAFDSSIVGLFWPLVAGGCVVLPTERQAHDPDALLELFGTASITHTLMVPTLYDALLERGSGQNAWPTQVIVAGEACPASLVQRHANRRPETALTNEYGPTEATVWATAHHCHSADQPASSHSNDIPIGQPIPGSWVAVVDADDRPVPPGVDGELVIGGQGVVDGYLDRSLADIEATERKFDDAAERTWLPSGRIFRTGDRAVVDPTGPGDDRVVRFLGRIDDQLNVGGVRVEPEDIERCILADPAIAAAVVTAADVRPLERLLADTEPGAISIAMRNAADDPDPAAALERALRRSAGSSEHQRLVAHLEGVTPLDASDVDRIRRRVATALPAALRPSAYSTHSALPRTPNGKVDRASSHDLPVAATAPAADPTAVWDQPGPVASGAMLGAVRRLFATTLGVESVPTDASFFDLGGHSLLALELLLQVERQHGVKVTVSSLYEQPTAEQLAALIVRLAEPETLTAQHQTIVPIQPHGTRPPIFGIHVLGSNGAFYRPLSDRLGPDQPVFGVGQAGTTIDHTASTDVRELAAQYVDDIERCAPDGPIVLAAVSLGSVVAFDVAQVLTSRGRHVARILLFDARGPDTPILGVQGRERIATHLRELRRSPGGWAKDRVSSTREQVTRRAEISAAKMARNRGASLPTRLRIREFIEANYAAQRSYVFDQYHGPVVVYRAGDDPFTDAFTESGMGWSAVVPHALDVQVVEGTHMSMLTEPDVASLAAAIHDQVASITTGTPVTLVEASLRHALAEQRLAAQVDDWRRRHHELSPQAADLIARCNQTLTTLAATAVEAGQQAVDLLDAAGVDAHALRVPDRMQFCAAHIVIHADAVTDAERHLIDAGYRRQGDATSGRTLLVRDDDVSSRLTLTTRSASRAEHAIVDHTDAADLGVFLATPPGLAQELLTLADVTSSDVVADIGCGDARVLVAAAQRFGCRAIGIENDPGLADAARKRVAEAGLTDLVDILEGDARTADISDATVAFVFLPAHIAGEMLTPLLDAVGPGGRVIAHEQLATEWPIPPSTSNVITSPDGITVGHLWHHADR